METTRHASATWSGNLAEGRGTVQSGSTAAIPETAITWKARTEEPGGTTSPEELLAAAHAACYSMAFSNQLAKAGFTPDHVATTATILFRKLEPGWTVVSSTLDVRATVPGVDEETFQRLAGVAKDGCPISRAIKGNVELAVNATLER